MRNAAPDHGMLEAVRQMDASVKERSGVEWAGWRLEVKVLEAVRTDSGVITGGERESGNQQTDGRFPDLTI